MTIANAKCNNTMYLWIPIFDSTECFLVENMNETAARKFRHYSPWHRNEEMSKLWPHFSPRLQTFSSSNAIDDSTRLPRASLVKEAKDKLHVFQRDKFVLVGIDGSLVHNFPWFISLAWRRRRCDQVSASRTVSVIFKSGKPLGT